MEIEERDLKTLYSEPSIRGTVVITGSYTMCGKSIVRV